MILLVALVCAAPFVSAWIAYYFYKPQGGKSYGTLLPTKSVVSTQEKDTLLDGKLKGKWVLIQTESQPCEAACREGLYASRQARTMLGRDKDRLVRVLVVKGALTKDIVADHPELLVAPNIDVRMASDPASPSVLLIDPLGNQVISFPKNSPDIKKMNADLMRLLKASRIG